MRVGARRAMATGAAVFGAGLAVAGLGVATHSLPLLYSGNLLCGVGYGCSYTPPLQVAPMAPPRPLQTMLDWFPDRRGLASGLVIAGFGSGALVFTPLVTLLAARWGSAGHPAPAGWPTGPPTWGPA